MGLGLTLMHKLLDSNGELTEQFATEASALEEIKVCSVFKDFMQSEGQTKLLKSKLHNFLRLHAG